MGWGEAAAQVSLTGEALQRVLGRCHSHDDVRIAKEWRDRCIREIRSRSFEDLTPCLSQE